MLKNGPNYLLVGEALVSKVNVYAAICAFIHLTAYGITFYIADSGWQRVAVFLFWQVLDFPISLIAIFSIWAGYWEWVLRTFHNHSVMAFVLSPPNMVNGILGTGWWFMLVRFIGSIRRGAHSESNAG